MPPFREPPIACVIIAFYCLLSESPCPCVWREDRAAWTWSIVGCSTELCPREKCAVLGDSVMRREALSTDPARAENT